MTIQSEQVGWVNTDQIPLQTDHVCFTTSPGPDADHITLIEYIREWYPHPQAPDVARVCVIVPRKVRTYKRTDTRCAATILMESAQNNCKQLPTQG